MFPNPATDMQQQRARERQQRAQVHETADALYRACAESLDVGTIEALLCQLAALTNQPRHRLGA